MRRTETDPLRPGAQCGSAKPQDVVGGLTPGQFELPCPGPADGLGRDSPNAANVEIGPVRGEAPRGYPFLNQGQERLEQFGAQLPGGRARDHPLV